MSEPDIKRTWVLEMSSPSDLVPKRTDRTDYEFRQVGEPSPEFNWFLHQAVGSEFRWGGREAWGRNEWVEFVSNPLLETWVGYLSGAPCGYSEQEVMKDGSVHLHCFGLLPRFHGRSLGGQLLTSAVEQAWNGGATRVWLSTCSHDHPHALQNYKARGFRVIEERTSPPNVGRESVIFTS